MKEHKGASSSLVTLVLKGWTELEDGSIAITSQMTAQEVDTNIQILKDELDLVAIRQSLNEHLHRHRPLDTRPEHRLREGPVQPRAPSSVTLNSFQDPFP